MQDGIGYASGVERAFGARVTKRGRGAGGSPRIKKRLGTEGFDLVYLISMPGSRSTELLRRFASGVRQHSSMRPTIRSSARNVDGLVAVLEDAAPAQPSIAVGIVGSSSWSPTRRWKAQPAMAELIKRLKDHKIERIAFERGVTPDELVAFMQPSRARGKAATPKRTCRRSAHPGGTHQARTNGSRTVSRSDMAAIRQMYSNAVAVGRRRRGRARKPRACPTLPAALQTVEGLADAVTQNRTALSR